MTTALMDKESRARAAHPARGRTRILIVSEDPYFIEEANAVLGCVGAWVFGCLGPAHTDCNLYLRGFCELAGHADVVLVDSPGLGKFTYHTVGIPAGEYAEALQRRYPETKVLLCGAPEGLAGPTGEIAVVKDRHEALYVLTRLLRAQKVGRHLKAVPHWSVVRAMRSSGKGGKS